MANLWSCAECRKRFEPLTPLTIAAPRLLEACTRARDYLSTIPESAAGGDDDAVALCRVLYEAIKAAIGETK